MNKLLYFSLLIAGCMVMMSCKKHKGQSRQSDPAVPVDVFAVKKEPVIYYNTYPASVVALQEVNLFSQVEGEVTGIFFNDGQIVNKGDKLYEINRSIYLAAYNQTKANLDIAVSNLSEVRRDSARYEPLVKQHAIPQQQYDNTLTSLQNAKQQVVAARAGLTTARTNLNYSLITAPFDGTIGISRVKTGSVVTPNVTLLNIISLNSPVGVDFTINENDLERFGNLIKNEPVINDSAFRIRLPDNTIYPYPGKIIVIDRSVNPLTGTVIVRLEFPNNNLILKPGMNCNAEILNKESGMQVIIPFKSVVEQLGEYFVYVVKSDSVVQTRIVPGIQVRGDIVVESGIVAGDTIVTTGVQNLHNGSRIQISQPTSRGSRGSSNYPQK